MEEAKVPAVSGGFESFLSLEEIASSQQITPSSNSSAGAMAPVPPPPPPAPAMTTNTGPTTAQILHENVDQLFQNHVQAQPVSGPPQGVSSGQGQAQVVSSGHHQATNMAAEQNDGANVAESNADAFNMNQGNARADPHASGYLFILF